MSTNLAALLLDDFRGDTLDRIASSLGETSAKTKSALSGAVPAIMSALASKASTSDGASDILNAIHQNHLDTDQFGSIASAVGSNNGLSNMMSMGQPLLSLLFGGRTNRLTDWISSFSGLKGSSATSLLSMALPMVLGFLSKRLGGVGASASHLMNLLGDQRSYLSAAPAGLTSALGLGDVSTIRREAASAGMSFGRWAWPVMLLGLIGLLWWGLSRRDTQVAVRNATRVVGANLGALVNKTLPLGTVLRIPSNGVESKLLAFIEDSNRVVDTNTWFTLDRIEFDTGSARLRPSSAEQMRNIADIMKAYPQVDLKVGGYTDNTGDSAANMALSQERAVNTMNAITGYGIDPSRLAAEGYGSQFPVASNATDDGRQRNRRIDIRVTKK